MRILLLFAALTFLPTSAGAQTLWRDVEAGMSVERLDALYPAARTMERGTVRRLDDVERVGDCTAHVVITVANGAVSRVTIFSQWYDALAGSALVFDECGDDAQAALTRRYGRPFESRTVGTGEQFRADRWMRGGVEIEFTRYGTASSDKWSITYKAVPRRGSGPVTVRPGGTAPPRPAPPADHFRELKQSLEAVRISDEWGGVQSYALSGTPCSPVLTQTWIDGEPGPEAELILTNATARTRVEQGHYHLLELSRPGEEPFAFSVDTAARGTQAAAALNALIRACAP